MAAPRLIVRTGLNVFSLLIVHAIAASAGEPASEGGKVAKPSPAAIHFFESKVRPVLADSCLKCHGPTKQSSGLRLDSREAMLKGGDNGPAVVPGNPDASLVVQAVTYKHEEIKMPPKGRLDAPQVSAIKQWISEGAYWPEATGKPIPSSGDPAKTHWAFQPVRRPTIPVVRDSSWIATPVDAFILSKLEANRIEPSSLVDRRTLIRRIAFDLVGLPPTAEEIEAFEADSHADAYARLVDRLLASPAYGERWGRHWLDVARYADTKGYVFVDDRNYRFAYTYRDYVVNAFNRDLPFDQFIMQQIAADQLPLGNDPRPLAAMGFLTVGRRFLNDQREIIDDRIDVVSRGFLGLTVTCARCHDHKFDPIPTADYYSLYGVFASSEEPNELPRLLPTGSKAAIAEDEHAKRVALANKARDSFLEERREEALVDFQGQFSRYFRAVWSLKFNPQNPELAKRAKTDSIDENRLRALAAGFQKGLVLVTRTPARESILQAWRSYSGLKSDEFAIKAKEVTAKLGAGGTHPLLTRALTARPPASMSEVVDRFTELFEQLETRLKDASSKKQAKLSDPEWESLRIAVFGPNGVATLPPESSRFLLKPQHKEKLAQLEKTIETVRAEAPPAVPRGMVMNDRPKPVDPHIFIRGNSGRPGKPVPRQFLQVLSGPDRKPFAHGSGRIDLARAIADPKNPLTARVLANRVWAWHFGQGLVTTPSDFGVRSSAPSHPELLDWLADELIRSGWSLKHLHRLIVLSSAYQQKSEIRPDCLERDAQNSLVWRYNRQRLDFEGMRDSILMVSGTIDPTIGGPSTPLNAQPFSTRRTLYGFIDRQNLDPVYRTFDFAVPDTTTPRRFVTTVPQQALFLMNSPFLQEQAKRLVMNLERNGTVSSDPTDVARQLYRRVLSRNPTDGELNASVRFLSQPPKAERANPAALTPTEQLAQVLLLTNEFAFVD